MADSVGNFQAGWNLAETMLFDISNRLRTARDSLLAGDLDKYYWNLETITRMIYGFLNDDEKTLATKKEFEILKFIPMKIETKGKLSALAKDYDGFLMMLLHNHKLLVPPRKDRSKLIA
jgi:hypothetical protein